MGIYLAQRTETSVSYDIQVFGKVALVLKITEKKVNGRKAPDESETFFIERRVVEPGKPTAHKIETAQKLMYFTPDNLELLWDDLAKGEDFFATLSMVQDETDAIKGIVDLDEHNFYYMNPYDHSFWRAGEDTPSSFPIYVDWIVGITDERYDLEAAEKVLQNNPRVTNLKKVDVQRQYYQADGGEVPKHALVFAFEFSQKQLNQIYRDHPKDCHPGWLADRLKGFDLDNFNFLKLKRARKKDK